MTTDVVHGIPVADPFRWLEDASSQRTRDWVAEQDRLAHQHLGALPARATMRAMLLGLLATTRTRSAPRSRGDHEFRAVRDRSWPNGSIQHRRGGGSWRTVVDPRTHPAMGADTALSTWEPSPTGRVLAVQVVHRGVESATPLYLLCAKDGSLLADPLPDTRFSSVVWLDDTRFVHSRQSDRDNRSGVYLSGLGGDDRLIFRLDEPGMRYQLTLWHDRWLAISARTGAQTRNGLWVADLADPDGVIPVLPVQPERDAATKLLIEPDGRLLLSTTHGAPHGQIVVASLADPARPWPTLIAHEEGAVVVGMALVALPSGAHRLVLVRNRDAHAEVTLHDPANGQCTGTVALPGVGNVRSLRTTSDGSVCLLTYTDWRTPPSTWRLDPVAHTTHRVDADGEPLAVGILRSSYPSDGVDVPITVLHPESDEATPSEPRPTILTCYGGFGVARRPEFQIELLAWVLAGGCVAIAGIRGGGERGAPWHAAGRGPNKVNSLRDLRAAGDWLVDRGWTRRDQLCLQGSSNGGMVVSGTLAAHPRAVAAAVCLAPLTDMVRYERSGLGARWRHEYGSAADPEQLRWLLAYSPYHNAAAGERFPATLVITGDQDTRVDPSHSWKFSALLQHLDQGGGPIILRTLANTGHCDSNAEQGLDMAATSLAFLAHHSGLMSLGGSHAALDR